MQKSDLHSLSESATEVTITYSTSFPHGQTVENAQAGTPTDSPPLPEPDDVRLKDLPVNLIEMGDVIGKGGMGVVRIARQNLPARDVAVKRLHFAKARLAKNLMAEAMTMGSLEHPNIVPIHLVRLTDDNSPEVVMKYIQGRPWNEILDKKPQRGDALLEALEILRAICHALEFAHSRNVIHRDVKPHNVMIGDYGEIYLMDWGIAIRQDNIETITPGLVGTPGYLAPEMLSGNPQDVSVQTDVFLLGATLHAILTGNRRHNATSVVGALDAADRSEPYDYGEEIPADLARLANHACSREVADRPDSVESFRLQIEKYLALRDSYAVRDLALEKKEFLRDRIKAFAKSNASTMEIRQVFAEAHFGLEQALQMSPDCDGAVDGLQETLLIMIDWLLDNRYLDEADHLRASLPQGDTLISERIAALQMAAVRDAAEVSYLKNIAPEYDPAPSRLGRYILGGAIMGIVAIACVLIVIYDTMYPSEITPKRLIVTTGSVALTILGTLFIARRWLFANRIGGRLASSVVFGFCCAPIFALAGIQGGFSANAIMVGNTLIVSLAMANSYPIVRTGRWAALFAMANVLIAAAIPSWAHAGFMLSTAFGAAAIAYDWTTRDFKNGAEGPVPEKSL